MLRTMRTALTLAALTTLAGAAQAAPDLQRVRGTIESSDGGSVTVKTTDGTSQTVQLGGAKFAWVVKSSLDQIKEGTFIGTATKGENPMTAALSARAASRYSSHVFGATSGSSPAFSTRSAFRACTMISSSSGQT